ncbi:hypothetical protein PR202_ga11149 [Eleusine coracana subsp. coracana]|uniref:Uncharacterized protein n=1 Tax=Eleusine coracana subsp. coracana TaxID=191504 RepID=A0AAV5C8Q9_ELECO|nr:hypothetical protein PR202_ga11149 [Eleusine coracana subsp. coracana]
MVATEMLVAAAVKQVARKITDVVGIAEGEVKLCCSFSDDLENIKDTLVYLESLLKNAENNSFGTDRANLRHWLGQIKSLAYDIEDIVEGYYSSKEEFEGSGYAQKVKMVHNMKSKRELLQRQRLPAEYHFISHINSAVNFEEKQTTSFRNKDIKIVGRDEDFEHLMSMLMQRNEQEISIIPIVGPVGLGKTSLAQLVFNDSRTKSFSFRIWVHVSMGNINIEKVGRDIILQTTERMEGNMPLQSIKNAIKDILNKHRCFIVIDSLWGKDEEVNELKQMLMTGAAAVHHLPLLITKEQRKFPFVATPSAFHGDDPPEPTANNNNATEIKQWKINDGKVMSAIVNSIKQSMIMSLRPFKTTKPMWDYLQQRYVKESGALLHTLMQKIHLIEQHDMTIDDYNSAFERLTGPLVSMVPQCPANACITYKFLEQFFTYRFIMGV